jgi:hypothetical protein
MIGKGPDYKGPVWVAVRIPDDCVAGHANQARIRTFPLDDPTTAVFPRRHLFCASKGYFFGKKH